MELGGPGSAHRRDRALALLNDLTVAVAIGAAGLLGAFAIIAATTIPGKSDNTALASTGSSGASTDGSGLGSLTGGFNGQTGLQQPGDHSVSQGGSSTPVVVTGGSR